MHLLISWNFICHADRVILHALFKNSHFSNCISTTEFKLQSGINYLKLFANNCCRSWEFEKGCGHQGGLRFDEDFSMRFRRLCFNTVRRGLCEGTRIDFSHHCSSQSLVIDRYNAFPMHIVYRSESHATERGRCSLHQWFWLMNFLHFEGNFHEWQNPLQRSQLRDKRIFCALKLI